MVRMPGRPDVSVTAADATTIVSVAGSLAASGSAAIGLGADVATITKQTEAYLGSNVTASIEGDLVVHSNSMEDVTSVAAGVGGGLVDFALARGCNRSRTGSDDASFHWGRSQRRCALDGTGPCSCARKY